MRIGRNALRSLTAVAAQLVSEGRRWWIAALVWETERVDNPIPPTDLGRETP